METVANIKQTLHRVEKIVDGWKELDMVSAIEKDIVLAKLQELYEMVRFSQNSEPAPIGKPQAAPVVEQKSKVEPEELPTRKMDRSAIMSLYCDQPSLELEYTETTTLEIREIPALEPESEPEVILEPELATIDMTDVATKITIQQSVALRKSIGVNDRFQLIRDLFGSDAMAYDAAINKLEEFSDLNEALLYIYENYQWDPNSDAVKTLIELLTRKLS